MTGKHIRKTEAAALMLGHFPVQKVTPLGLLSSYCLCGIHLTETFTYPAHIVALLEGTTNA